MSIEELKGIFQKKIPKCLWFIFVSMFHCCTMVQNCPGDGHVAAFITLK